MKKLTAGIFATILGLTAMGAADAAVTSKAYVDAAVASAKSDVTTLGERVTTAEGKITTAEGKITTIEGQQTTQDGLIQANADAIGAIEADYLKAADKTTLQENINAVANAAATKTALEEGLALKADKTFVGELPAGATATTVVGFVQEKTANIASDATVSALGDRVTAAEGKITAAEGKITTIEGQQTTQDGLIQANADAIGAIEADYLKAADKTELQTQITANKTAAEAAQGTANTAVSNAATAQAAAEAAQATADKAIQAPAACSDPTNMCVLVSDGTSVTWQVIANVYPDNNGTL